MIKQALLILTAILLSGPVFGADLENYLYQGRLADADGKALADGMHTVSLSVYDQEDARDNAAVWKDTYRVQAQSGVFQVVLGTSPAAPMHLASGKPYWIGIGVDSGSELKPRQIMGGVSLPKIPGDLSGAPGNEKATTPGETDSKKEYFVSELCYGNNAVNVSVPKLAYGKDQTEAGNKRIVFPKNYFNKPPIVLCTAFYGNEAQLISVADETSTYADIKSAVLNGNACVTGGYIGFNWVAIGW
jgi:hypothetical protein